MPPRVELPPHLLQGVFTTADARAAGIAPGRLRGPDIAHPFHGVNSGAELGDDLLARCEALRPVLGEQQALSHVTAARRHGIPLPMPWRSDEPLHVTAMSGAPRMQRPGVVGWETGRTDLPWSMLGSLPVVSPATVWAQLSMPGAILRPFDPSDPASPMRRSALSPEWLVAVGDFLVSGPRSRDRQPLCTHADLAAALGNHRGKRGAKALAWALPLVRHPVDSPKETMLRLGLIEFGLPEPAVQVAVVTSAGLRHADLGYPAQRLLLEYQGDGHRTSAAQWREDLTRLQLFQDAGYTVIAVTAADLEPNCRALAQRVRRVLSGQPFGA